MPCCHATCIWLLSRQSTLITFLSTAPNYNICRSVTASCISSIINHNGWWAQSQHGEGLPHSPKTNCDHLMKGNQVPLLSVDLRSSDCGGVLSIGLPMLWLRLLSIILNNCTQQSSNTFLNNHPSCLYIMCRTLNEDAIHIADYTSLVSCSAYGPLLMYCFTV